MVSPTDIEYAQKLRGLRLSKNMKQAEASTLLKFNSQQQYSRLENGQAVFSDEIIAQICEVFKITPEQFTGNNHYFFESPYANAQIGGNNHSNNNDTSIIHELLKAKDEIIKGKDELLEKLKQEIILLKSKS